MRLAVLGATGPTGAQIVTQALDRSHAVVALARYPDAATPGRPGLTVVAADVLDPNVDLAAALGGVDAVLSALGMRKRQPTTVYSEGIRCTVEAMSRQGSRRLICISSEGIEIPPGLPFAQRLVMRTVIQRLYRHAYTDMARMEAFLDTSPTDWTVVRAPLLTDGPASSGYRVSLGTALREGASPRRADLARFMIDAVDQPETYRRRVHLASPKEKKRP